MSTVVDVYGAITLDAAGSVVVHIDVHKDLGAAVIDPVDVVVAVHEAVAVAVAVQELVPHDAACA